MRLNVFSDGGARGNPGPSAIAFIVVSETGEVMHKDQHFLGNHTNNQAEYWAIITALEYVDSLKVEEVTCFLDSELVVRQLTGQYTTKNLELRKLKERVLALKGRFSKVSFANVPRTNQYIQEADNLLNKALDAEERR